MPLTAGTILTRAQLCELTDTPHLDTFRDTQAYNRYTLSLVSLYTNLNKTLRDQGMCIEAKNYYTEFHVLGGEEAEKKIKAYEDKAAASAFCANQLRQGVRTFNSARNRFNT